MEHMTWPSELAAMHWMAPAGKNLTSQYLIIIIKYYYYYYYYCHKWTATLDKEQCLLQSFNVNLGYSSGFIDDE